MTKELHWKVIDSDYGGNDTMRHVIPHDDLCEHTTDMLNKGEDWKSACWCGAALKDGIVVHNSADKRELYERGERQVA